MSVKSELSRARLEPVTFDRKALLKPDWPAMGMRFGFGAGIALVAGLVALRFGPRIGGAFLAFPAVLPAALTHLEKKSGRSATEVDALGAILGSVAMIAFAVAAALALPSTGLLGVLLAAAIWMVVALAMFGLARFVLRTSGVRGKIGSVEAGGRPRLP